MAVGELDNRRQCRLPDREPVCGGAGRIGRCQRNFDKMEKYVESWEDISIILYDGNKEEIRGLRCPVCGGEISYSFDMKTGSNTIKCEGSCGMYSRGHGDTGYIPNCVKYFGEVYTIE